MNLTQYFLAFIAYSVIGWIYESVLYTVQERRLIFSGFLFGPWCPIYGGGAVIMVFCFYGRTDSVPLLFFGGAAFATILEYLTAVAMENIFHKKWWNYSKMRYNFQGRICLLGAMAFGTLCAVLCRVVHPGFVERLSTLSEDVQYRMAVTLLFMFLIDYIATVVKNIVRKRANYAAEDSFEDKLPQLDMAKIYASLGLKKHIDPIKEMIVKRIGR